MNALIFDCDGVLADTERYGHLPAFNATFEAFGVPLRWSDADYAEKLRIGGGKERMASAFTPEVRQQLGLSSEAEVSEFIAKLHAAKTQAFKDIVASGKLPGRPGIARLSRAMHERGWLLAVASTSAEPSVRAVLESVVGREFARNFAIFAGDVVPHKKPAPDIYTLAIAELGIDASEALAVEDSRNGLVAATTAGLTCVVTLSAYTQEEDMHEATLVVSSLGEPDGPASDVVANRSRARVGSFVTPEDLEVCVRAGTAHAPS